MPRALHFTIFFIFTTYTFSPNTNINLSQDFSICWFILEWVLCVINKLKFYLKFDLDNSLWLEDYRLLPNIFICYFFLISLQNDKVRHLFQTEHLVFTTLLGFQFGASSFSPGCDEIPSRVECRVSDSLNERDVWMSERERAMWWTNRDHVAAQKSVIEIGASWTDDHPCPKNAASGC